MGCRNCRAAKTDSSIIKPEPGFTQSKVQLKSAEPTKIRTRPTEEDSEVKSKKNKYKEEFKVEREVKLVAEK